MHREVKIPFLPEAVEQAEIAEIYVNQGQLVKADDILFEVETEKVVLEVTATTDGIADEIMIAPGDSVTSEQVVMQIRPQREGEEPVKAKDNQAGATDSDLEPCDVVIPVLPESESHGVIATIHVNQGQQVKRDQALFDVELDKAVLEIPAPYSGIVDEITIAEGHWVNSEQAVMVIRPQEEGEIPVTAKIPVAEPKPDSRQERGQQHIEPIITPGIFPKGGLIFAVLGAVLGILATVFVMG